MQQDVNTQGCPRTSYTYMVQQGDSLQTIATAYNTTVDAILRANRAATEQLRVGQVLCIPFTDVSNTGTPGNVIGEASGDTATQPTPPTITIIPGGTACPTGYAARTIRAGETYADLLIDNNVSYQAMRTANPTLNPAQLVTGTRYCAPPSGTRQPCTRYHTYRLTEGENLSAVARAFDTTPGRLLMLNPTLLPTDFTEGAIVCVP